MLPIMYKMGVMSTLLLVLTAISLKGLMIGATLLLLNLSAIFGKIYLWAHSAKSQGWGEEGPGHKDVHVHIHNSGHSGYYEHHDKSDQLVYDDEQYMEPYYRRQAYWRTKPPLLPAQQQSLSNVLSGYYK